MQFLRNRQINKTKTFYIEYSVPEPLAKHFVERPTWLSLLSTELRRRGLQEKAPDDSNCTLLIEAYDGPQVALSRNKKKHELTTESKLELETTLKAQMAVKFVSSELDFSNEENGSSNTLYFAKRLANGIELATPRCNRIIPNLDGQCSFARLADILLSHISSLDNG
jgi:hypothetical protein